MEVLYEAFFFFTFAYIFYSDSNFTIIIGPALAYRK